MPVPLSRITMGSLLTAAGSETLTCSASASHALSTNSLRAFSVDEYSWLSRLASREFTRNRALFFVIFPYPVYRKALLGLSTLAQGLAVLFAITDINEICCQPYLWISKCQLWFCNCLMCKECISL